MERSEGNSSSGLKCVYLEATMATASLGRRCASGIRMSSLRETSGFLIELPGDRLVPATFLFVICSFMRLFGKDTFSSTLW